MYLSFSILTLNLAISGVTLNFVVFHTLPISRSIFLPCRNQPIDLVKINCLGST